MGMKQQAGIKMRDQEIVNLEEPAKRAGFTKHEPVRNVVPVRAVQVVLDAEDEG
ncbi:MAG: hypothetical protein IH870_08555 [Chloroflexi bacterium]|nr:hypothetical protein [Chloroflexota bacterium]